MERTVGDMYCGKEQVVGGWCVCVCGTELKECFNGEWMYEGDLNGTSKRKREEREIERGGG